MTQVPNFVKEDDGTFYISFQDYLKFFYITTICDYDENSCDKQVADEGGHDGFNMIKLTIPRELDEAVFTIS